IAAFKWIESQTREGEWAVAGQLQLPPAVYQLERVSAFNQNKESLYDLYQQGFTAVVVGPGYKLSDRDTSIFSEVKRFEGIEEKQRIVRDPAITVFEINEIKPETIVKGRELPDVAATFLAIQ